MELLIITIPLLSAISIYSFSKYIGKEGGKIIGVGAIIINTIISILFILKFIIPSFTHKFLWLEEGREVKIFIKDWINLITFKSSIELEYDKTGLIMTLLISIITMIVIIYSIFYMSHESNRNNFICKLLIFAVTMYILVLSNNFIILFIGWEGVGIMSFLLINFWSSSINSNKSAFKAILYNKIGDISLLLGIGLIVILINNGKIYITDNFNNWQSIILFTFVIAAMAKSAQIFFHPWLGDAMAGPTPVSALLHAATMVTAGIVLLTKVNCLIPISHHMVNQFILIIGVLTILFGSLSALFQKDIKKIIAYSTTSQIGYMFINFGFIYFNKYSSLFHLFTHGFFKALLFISSGIIIHNFLSDQDIRKFGSLLFKTPLSFIYFLIGSFSIIGFPFLSGFYSKENIILFSLYKNNFSFFLLLILSIAFTSFYSFSFLFRSFFDYSKSSSLLYFSPHSPNLPEVATSSKAGYNVLIYYVIFFIASLGSIFIGFISKDFILLNNPVISNIENIDMEIITDYLPINIIPLLILFTLFAFYFIKYFFNIYFPTSLTGFIFFYWKFHCNNLFNRRVFFDTLFNFFTYPFLFFSYHISYKLVDRGFLEFFGPLGLFRLFYYFPKTFGLNIHYYYSPAQPLGKSFYGDSSSYLFIYIFFSFATLLAIASFYN